MPPPEPGLDRPVSPASDVRFENPERTLATAVVDGATWSGIGPEHRFWPAVLAALEGFRGCSYLSPSPA